ncbi:MAG: hypothetical protein A2219_01445 [Elusimicrobia bacterium RIFOXYA2_FULL_50_26]|nr:MAG: hypothetical protein A2219_01445 [Elusimicrobia bacterium RIFOXYA2_FULL_50_26]OGS24590.1 MAG: hypothetical protein A2314_00290 [Elusimicrobia bacterium RIFOXYB2_FULL_50_12]
MKTKCRFLPTFLLAFICVSSLISASEIVVAPTQIAAGGWSISAYYGLAEEKVSLQVNGRDEIQVAGNVSYLSDVSNVLDCPGRARRVMLKSMFNPYGNVSYWLSAGAGYYELQVPSQTVKNTFSGQSPGIVVGLGFRSVLFPDTIVTPSISVEAGIQYGYYAFDSMAVGNEAAQPVNDLFERAEIQAAVLVGKRLRNLEIYGGLKVMRTAVVLKDKTTLGSVSGNSDSAGVMAGVKLHLYPEESLFIEGNLAGENGIAAGWNIKF